MITFFIAILVLLFGYFVYGKLIENIFGIDTHRKTPAITMADGVDFVPMKPWRIYLIQFLSDDVLIQKRLFWIKKGL